MDRLLYLEKHVYLDLPLRWAPDEGPGLPELLSQGPRVQEPEAANVISKNKRVANADL